MHTSEKIVSEHVDVAMLLVLLVDSVAVGIHAFHRGFFVSTDVVMRCAVEQLTKAQTVSNYT